MLTGLLVGIATAHADALDGTITFIDAKNDLIQVVPLSPHAGGKNISVSVSEFIKAHGPGALDDLDVGKHVFLTVQKDSVGRWAMTAIQRPEVIVPEAQEDGTFLKTTGKPKESSHFSGVFRKLKFER